MDLVATLATIGFVGVFLGCTIASGRMFGLEQRARLLQRRDPGLADALRRAEFMSDLRRGGGFSGVEGFSAVCTPSRRSRLDMARVRGADSDLRVQPPEEVLPPMPATVVALAGSEHVPQAPRPRHPLRTGQPAGAVKSSGHQPTASG